MTARYRPKGLLGIAYWHAVSPLHNLVFGGMLKGIRDTAEAMNRGKQLLIDTNTSDHRQGSRYGRARLYLGMSAVGSMVVLAALGLSVGLPQHLDSLFPDTPIGIALGLASFVGGYALLHLPFDVLGGYLLPKWFDRNHPRKAIYLRRLARGIVVHGALLLCLSILVTTGGYVGGVVGAVLVSCVAMVFLLLGRVALATMMAPLKLTPSDPENIRRDDSLGVLIGESDDEAFTGGVLGVLRPTRHVLPLEWKRVLGKEGFALALERRSVAAKSGGWRRGRVVAGLFTVLGVTLSAIAVGSDQLGTLGGTVSFSLWFTLWSFLGLLVLPTFSRWGVAAVDQQVRKQAPTTEGLDRTTRELDRLQDDEPSRPTLIETIFHPIPSVENRVRGPRTHGILGAWDAARTAVYLSASGIGLLGRSVHCNCGRTALWVLLPTD